MLLFNTPLAGAQFHNLHTIKDKITIGDPLTLVPDPKNKFDPLAIEVWHKGAVMIGFIPKRWCETIHKVIEEHKELKVTLGDYNPLEKSHKQITLQFNN